VRMHGDNKRENWLLIKAKDDQAQTDGAATGFLDDRSFSVKTGRSMDAMTAGEVPARMETKKIPAWCVADAEGADAQISLGPTGDPCRRAP